MIQYRCIDYEFFLKYNRSSIKGDENYFYHFNSPFSFLKYNRSSIKGDENPFLSFFNFFVLFKYNRSSIKGDENYLTLLFL